LSKGGKGGFPIIGITPGDPQGIGPEVIEKALASRSIQKICRPVVFGHPELFDFRKAKRLTPRQCGQLSAFYIRQATEAAMRGQVAAVVTAPISKERLQLAGCRYPGHTEFLADLTGSRQVRMMMAGPLGAGPLGAGPRLKVILVTIHEPLKKVAGLLTVRSIAETILVTDQALRKWFGLKRPRLAVAGLNPHAGEGGLFGREEGEKIAPAIRFVRRKGVAVEGPFSPDTVFCRAAEGEFDAVVAMYHDQGLIPLKILHFKDAVNITLGLPIIRTSVDHGTAFDIAGKGIADPRSMIEAIRMAVEMARK